MLGLSSRVARLLPYTFFIVQGSYFAYPAPSSRLRRLEALADALDGGLARRPIDLEKFLLY